MSKFTSLMTEIKTHWKTPDTSKGRYVPYREYIDIFMSEGMNYGAQAPLGYIGFAATCYIIMYHYNLPYLAFSVISLIGVPFSYLWKKDGAEILCLLLRSSCNRHITYCI